jgi:hypothetical protein
VEEDFAVKRMPIRSWQLQRCAARFVVMCFREMTIQKMCVPPAILTAYVWQFYPDRKDGEVQIVTELMRNGSLFEKTNKITESRPE